MTKSQVSSVKIGCHYEGGNNALGRRGRHLWIEDGRIGHGEVKLTHSVPMTDVVSVEVTERDFGGSEASTLIVQGQIGTGKGRPATAPKQLTDITVRTKDDQEALWVVEGRSQEWV
ncbi:MAG: hypothetical protein ACLPR9_07855 [Acidimicrobiales bacterium]